MRVLHPRRAPLLLAGPLVAYIALLLVYPTGYALRLAFTDTHTGDFPSSANFRLLWSDSLFWQSLLVNALFPIVSVAFELVIGLALAVFLVSRFPGRRALRAIVIIPFALPEIVFLTVMRYIFAPRGYANGLLLSAGLAPIDWLLPGRPITFLTVVLADAWHVIPIVYLTILAGLMAIPEEIVEAAQLDGARPWRRFTHVTLPLLRPAIVAAVLLRGLDALRVFAAPLVLAGVEGLPVLSTYAYHQWSDYGNDGAAAAAACLLALLSVCLTAPLLRYRQRID